MDETRKPVLDWYCSTRIISIDPSLLPMESSRDKGDDTRVGYDIDTTATFEASAFDVCRLLLGEIMVGISLLAITTCP